MLSLNWAKQNSYIKNNDKEIENTIYTAYVGNLDNSTEEEELTTFFKNEFSSVKSSKIIRDSNGKSKGFGFINLQDFNEYMGLLKLDRPLIFKGQILIIN